MTLLSEKLRNSPPAKANASVLFHILNKAHFYKSWLSMFYFFISTLRFGTSIYGKAVHWPNISDSGNRQLLRAPSVMPLGLRQPQSRYRPGRKPEHRGFGPCQMLASTLDAFPPVLKYTLDLTWKGSSLPCLSD